MTELEYQIVFPKTDAFFFDNQLTFSINHIKSRFVSTLYFIIEFYDMHDNPLYTYTSDRWIIDNEYGHRHTTFNISQGVADKTAKYKLTLVAIGITSENPLYFNQVMLQQGEFIQYHIPMSADDNKVVKFHNCAYCNLYDKTGNYLQVIRPNLEDIQTTMLPKSSCTVLAPHLSEESVLDDPINVFLEFVNQKEQKITVLR